MVLYTNKGCVVTDIRELNINEHFFTWTIFSRNELRALRVVSEEPNLLSWRNRHELTLTVSM